MLDERRVAVFQQFGRTYRTFMSAFETHVGQPMPRWRIVFALQQQGGSLSQKRLVELLQIDPGALTRQLKVLETLRWVTRSTDERDNRVTNVVLTEAGEKIVLAGLPHRAAFLDTATAGLSHETLEALSAGLTLLEQGVAKAQQLGTDEANTQPE